MSNKQESHEGVEEIVREFESHPTPPNLSYMSDWLRQKLTPLVAQNTDNPPTGFNWDKFDMDKFFKEADEVGRIRAGVAQKEQKEGVECCKLCSNYVRACMRDNGIGDTTRTISGKYCTHLTCDCHLTPTPTVKEESHTQGWKTFKEIIRKSVREGIKQYEKTHGAFEHTSSIEKRIAGCLFDPLYSVMAQEYERGLKANPAVEHCAEPACPECDKAAFNAGYAQCKVDAVAVVEGAHDRCRYSECCMGKSLTALSALTSKK